jgi:aspartokinase
MIIPITTIIDYDHIDLISNLDEHCTIDLNIMAQSMRRVISKFGGSSVGDATAMRRTARLLLSQSISRAIEPVAVCSATFGSTDRLVEAVRAARRKDRRTVGRCRSK